MRQARAPNRLVTLTCAIILTFLAVWALYLGQSILLPVILGIISVYILTTAADALGRLPLLDLLGRRLRRFLVFVSFMMLILMLSAFVTANAQAISAAIPGYSSNLEQLQLEFMRLLSLHDEPNLRNLGNELLDFLDVTALMPQIVSLLSNMGTLIVTAGLYAVFILTDLDRLPDKMRLAFGDTRSTEQTLQVVREVNHRIGRYLAAKTLMNILLAALSLLVMLILGIEFAVFWAILIGLLNYIPYIGSVIAVVFPVTLSLVQFGTLNHAAVLLGLLLLIQMFVGYYLEPKMLGRSVNLAPFTVLLALAVWSALWGLTGAILAVPLTAMIAIVLAEFPSTRFLSVMMSEDGRL